MNTQKLIDSMDRFRHILPALVRDVSDEDARWKPASGGWSILEVVCHLADEEVDDFRPRVKSTLEDPEKMWTPIDTEGAAVSRKYNEQDLEENLQRFLAERNKSLAWLRSLENPEWNETCDHPQVGPLAAGTVMAGWAAHDQMHIRQITKRLFEINQRDAAPFLTSYGGEWKA